MPTPRAGPPTVDVKMEALQKNLLNASEFGKLKEGARAASQEAASRERRRNATDPWPVPARGVRKCRANAGTASAPQVVQAPGSDPGAPHNVALVRFNTKPDSEKANTAAPNPALQDVSLPLTFVDIQRDMSLQLEEEDVQES